MEPKKFERALVYITSDKRKTYVTVYTNCPLINAPLYGEMAEDVSVSLGGETLKLSYKVGRWFRNHNTCSYWDDEDYILKPSVSTNLVVERDTELVEVRKEMSRLFRKNLPALFEVLPKNGYVELKNPIINDVEHAITNFHLKIDEKKYEPSK